jgi:hypothetical protein
LTREYARCICRSRESSCLRPRRRRDPRDCGPPQLARSEGSYPEIGKDIDWPTDLMVLKVKKGGRPLRIEQFMGDVSVYTYGPAQNVHQPLASPKYESPTAQLDMINMIRPGDDTYCENGY